MGISFGLKALLSALILVDPSSWSADSNALHWEPLSLLRVQLQEERPSPDAKTERETKSNAAKSAAHIESLCSAIEREAFAQDLPLQFFARLIWQESRLDPLARSRVGAQGIAQFMPGTARWRGLGNPFEPYAALHESARWLRELLDQFGNLGLAAAAYNAGPRRIQDWLEHGGNLPGETRAYVKTITGRSADEWGRAGRTAVATPSGGAPMPCLANANFAKAPSIQPQSTRQKPQATHRPWAVQLIGDSSETRALAEYRALQQKHASILGDRPPVVIKNQVGAKGSGSWFRVRVAELTRERAMELCSRLRSNGGSCLVAKN
jgi:hypothetical protein